MEVFDLIVQLIAAIVGALTIWESLAKIHSQNRKTNQRM